MKFGAPTKDEDGLYYARVKGDDGKKIFVQLNKVKCTRSSTTMAEFAIEQAGNKKKIRKIEDENIATATEKSEEWFGSELTPEQVKAAYSSIFESTGRLGVERIPPTKVFTSNLEQTDFESIAEGKTCNLIVEFAGLYFARSSFGPMWNLVQAKLHADPIVSEYPEEPAFADEDEDEDEATPEVGESEQPTPEAEAEAGVGAEVEPEPEPEVEPTPDVQE
jgi:hypothetical protein